MAISLAKQHIRGAICLNGALTGLLIDPWRNTPGSRVVNVSSEAHRFSKLDFEDLQAEQSYTPAAAYEQRKLANLLFTCERPLQPRFASAASPVGR